MRRVRILLAEDDPAHQELLAQALSADRPFLDVSVVATGDGFKRTLQRQRFDCVVIDYRLPDITADELLRAVEEDLRDCPALVISSIASQKVAVSSVRSGSVDFVPKTEALESDGLWRRIQVAIRKTERKRKERHRIERRHDQLARLAETDHLTGLYNRRYLDRQLQARSYQRDRRREMSCIMMDIDHFKRINDTHGHAAGDSLLKDIAEMVRSSLSGGDMALRWGGDELLILRSSTGLCEAWIWSEGLKARVEHEIFRAGRKDLRATVSMGVVVFPTPKMGQEMIELADQAMYLAKRQGRGRVCTFPMVAVDQALAKLDREGPAGPTRRRVEFLAACDGILGPTQKHHLWGHSSTVGAVANGLGRVIGMPEQNLQAIRLAGLFHDLGKCVIPEELLAERGPLTKQQWALIQGHSDLGADMAVRLGAPREVAACVRDHHRPYSRAYTTNSFLPLGARVICAADALAAMTEERPYRPARSHGEALAELTRASGSQFDPSVAAAAHGIEPLRSSKAA